MDITEARKQIKARKLSLYHSLLWLPHEKLTVAELDLIFLLSGDYQVQEHLDEKVIHDTPTH